MANRNPNNNSKSSSSSSSQSKQVPGNPGVINNGRSTTLQGPPKTTSNNNNSRNTPFQTGIAHVDAIINQSGLSKSTSSSKSKRPPLRQQPPAANPPLGDNIVDNDGDGFGTTRTFNFENRTPANPGLNLNDLIQSPRLFSQLESSQRPSNLQTSFNPSTSSINNVSLI